MANYKLHYGTQAEYDAKKGLSQLVQDDLYFTSDTLCIYKGDKLLSAAVEVVEDEFPESGAAQGRFYINTTTLESKIWNGAAWTVVSPAVASTLDTDTPTGSLVTAGAIRTYVQGIAGGHDLVKNVTYDAASQKVTITYGDDNTAEILLKNLLIGASYDGETGNFTFNTANGEPIVVNTPKENFLKAAAYDPETHMLTLTLADKTKVEVNLEELIDTYTANATDSVNLQVSGNAFTANVKVSAEEGNILEIKSGEKAGLYVPAPAEALIKSVKDTSTVNLEIAAEGALQADVKVSGTAGNQLTTDGQGLFVPATDLSNYYNKSEVYAKTETYSKSEVDAAINAVLTWEEI